MLLAEMESQLDEGGGRILLGDDAVDGGGHAAVDQVPVYLSLFFSCTPLHVYIYN